MPGNGQLILYQAGYQAVDSHIAPTSAYQQ